MCDSAGYVYSRMDRPHTAARGRKRLKFGGTFQVLLGLLLLGANTLVVVFLGFGWFFGVGFAAGLMLLLAGSVAVHKARTSREPQHKAVKVLSVLAALLSLGILGVSGVGVYFDMMFQNQESERVSSTITMASNIVMAFLGMWSMIISLWMACTASSAVQDSTKSQFSNGVTDGGKKANGKWAQSRGSLSGNDKDKVNYDQKKTGKVAVGKHKSQAENAVVVATVQNGNSNGSKAKIPRQSKNFDRISMNPDPDDKSSRRDSSTDYSDESYDDDDEGYNDSDISDDGDSDEETNLDGVDMNDPEAVAAARRRRRRRRRRKRFKKFELVKGEKKVTKAIDPFSKDRKIKRTWDKKPKNEFKMTKAQEIRMKKLQEQKEKEAKAKK